LGLLTAVPNVTSNQAVRITSSYTVDGVTRSDTHDITINNLDPVLTGLTISGVNTVNEGESAQYMARATLSDNSMPEVTMSAVWSEDSTVASINSTGLFTVDSDSGNQQITITASYTHEEVTITDTFVVTVVGFPNIAPYQPDGWSNRIVVSNITGTTVNSLSLAASDSLYVDWAIANIGGAEATAVNSTYVMYLDNVFLDSWSNIGAIPPVSTSGTFLQITDIPIGPLADGVHTLRLVADSNNTITEGNETDNEYTLSFTVDSSIVCMSPNQSIPDNNLPGVDSTITVASGGIVDDIGVKLVSNHTNPGDLTASLSFNGTNVLLMDQPGVPDSSFGCGGDNIDAIFDESSISPVEGVCGGSPGIGGFVLPEDELSNFDGMSLNGDWVLNIFDNASGNTGNLEAWCLYTKGGPLIFVDGYEKSKIILPIPPAVTLSANPTSVSLGGSSTLTWSIANNATACTKLGDWSGSLTGGELEGGSLQISNITSNATYNLQCSNSFGPSTLESVTIGVVADAATQLVVTIQPTDSVVGTSISTIRVEAQDANGLIDTTNNSLASISLDPNSGTFGAVLSGTTLANVVNGVATFSGLDINTIGSGYKLNINSNAGLASTTTDLFDIVNMGSAPTVALTANPTTVAFGGSSTLTWSVANNATACTKSGAWSGKLSGGDLIGGTLQITNIASSATYSLQCSNAFGQFNSSVTIFVEAGMAAQLVVTTQPTNTSAGNVISTIRVEAQDVNGLLDTSNNSLISISLDPSSGTFGATLSGITLVNVVNGVAEFSTLSIDLTGSGYKLSIVSNVGLTSATSDAFDIIPPIR